MLFGLSARTKVYPGTSKLPSLDEIIESKQVSERHIMSNLLIEMLARRRDNFMKL